MNNSKFDVYVCERCGYLQKEYSRFCSICNGEKTMSYKKDLLLLNLLYNILSTMDPDQFFQQSQFAGVITTPIEVMQQLHHYIDPYNR